MNIWMLFEGIRARMPEIRFKNYLYLEVFQQY